MCVHVNQPTLLELLKVWFLMISYSHILSFILIISSVSQSINQSINLSINPPSIGLIPIPTYYLLLSFFDTYILPIFLALFIHGLG